MMASDHSTGGKVRAQGKTRKTDGPNGCAHVAGQSLCPGEIRKTFWIRNWGAEDGLMVHLVALRAEALIGFGVAIGAWWLGVWIHVCCGSGSGKKIGEGKGQTG